MSRRRHTTDRSQRGYSLAEIMVVVAIIGILSMITIPNFTAMYRAGLVKNSLRQFATDLRGARARAVSTYSPIRITFDEGARPGSYSIFRTEDNGTTWLRIGPPRALQQRVYFKNVNFADTIGSDDLPDIVFRGDGTADAPGGAGTVQIRIDDEIQKNVYEVEVRTTGKVTTH